MGWRHALLNWILVPLRRFSRVGKLRNVQLFKHRRLPPQPTANQIAMHTARERESGVVKHQRNAYMWIGREEGDGKSVTLHYGYCSLPLQWSLCFFDCLAQCPTHGLPDFEACSREVREGLGLSRCQIVKCTRALPQTFWAVYAHFS